MEKPVFVATHPRAISTAFERIFMTRPDILTCVHEPFGDAFYFGPERMSPRYEGDDNREAREESGFAETTFATAIENLGRVSTEGKRLFIKDMIYYLVPHDSNPAVASSLVNYKRGVGTAKQPTVNGTDQNSREHGKNPSVIPDELLRDFHFTFLIRHPRASIPSYFRCTVPPLDKITGFYKFLPSEAGYSELRRFFDYLVYTGQVGPNVTQQGGNESISENGYPDDAANATKSGGPPSVAITVIDADELLSDPEGIVRTYCEATGIEFKLDMLSWDDPKDEGISQKAFEKWPGFHDDVIDSKGIVKKPKKHPKSDAELFDEWTSKFGIKGAEVIRDTVAANVADYEYLKKFAIKPRPQDAQDA